MTRPQPKTDATGKSLPTRPRGRPPKRGPGKYPENTVLPYLEDIEKLGRLGATKKQLSDRYGYEYTDFFDLLRKYPQLTQAYMQGRGKGLERGLEWLWIHIEKGDKACLFFLLERVYGLIPKSELAVETTNKPPVELTVGQQRAMAEAVLANIKDVEVVNDAAEPNSAPQIEASAIERVLEGGKAALSSDMGEIDELRREVAAERNRAAGGLRDLKRTKRRQLERALADVPLVKDESSDV